MPARESASQPRAAAASACSAVPPSTSRPCLAYSSSTDTSPSRSRSDAGPSQSLANRRTSASWWTRPCSATSDSAPPGPIAPSWRGSPTSSSLAPAAWQRATISASDAVSAVPASSSTTRSSRRSRHGSSPPGAPSGFSPAGAARAVEPALRGQPRRHVAGGEPLAAEDVGGDLVGREPEHPRARPVVARVRVDRAGVRVAVAPGVGDRADDERLAGPGGGHQDLDLRAGGEHAAQRGGLVVAERDAGLGVPLDEPVGDRGGQRRGAARRRRPRGRRARRCTGPRSCRARPSATCRATGRWPAARTRAGSSCRRPR